MNNTGIYLLKKKNETFTKLSKTNNIRQTYSTFRKEINNIQFISFDINTNPKSISNLESFLLTLFSEFRIKKSNSNYLTEFIDIDINILKTVIKYLINNIYWFENNDFEYPKCENQIYSNLNKFIINNKILIDSIIKDLIDKLEINYPTPMEVENEEFQVYLDYSDLKYLINSFNFKI